jgi:hypothetical protein
MPGQLFGKKAARPGLSTIWEESSQAGPSISCQAGPLVARKSQNFLLTTIWEGNAKLERPEISTKIIKFTCNKQK